jgi:hypothetical protein
MISVELEIRRLDGGGALDSSPNSVRSEGQSKRNVRGWSSGRSSVEFPSAELFRAA